MYWDYRVKLIVPFLFEGKVVKKIVFDFESALVSQDDIKKIGEKLIPEMKNIKKQQAAMYETDYASLYVPSDPKLLDAVEALIEKKKKLHPSVLIVIGIGGSNLGTIAIHKALQGDFYNEKKGSIKVYFADTVDSDYLENIVKLVEGYFASGKNILINVVTKSGTTTETIVNFEIFFELIKRHRPDNYNDYIVVTTDKGSKLWDYADQNNMDRLEIPKKVGGRFSVFTPVGLFPLGILGINIKKLLSGAKSVIKDCMSEDILSNPAVLSASVIFYHYKKGANIHDMFVFSKYLRNFGQWYRQLVGESVGKKFNKEGDLVEVGVTPTVSVGTVDLHSVAQLYLGGPQDKFTTFITVQPKNEIYLPTIDAFNTFVANIQGKSVSFIMDSIFGGVKAAYKNDGRPFVSVNLPAIDEYFMGQLLQWKMLEITELLFAIEHAFWMAILRSSSFIILCLCSGNTPEIISSNISFGFSVRGLSEVKMIVSAICEAILPMIGLFSWSRSPPAPNTKIRSSDIPRKVERTAL